MKKILVFSLILVMTSIAAMADVTYNQDLYDKAVSGDAKAQCNLGDCYYFGKGITKDYSQAVYWWRKAAEQGNAYAQNSLGNFYYYGNGVSQDYTQAVYWYRKAARQGDEDAQDALKNLGYSW